MEDSREEVEIVHDVDSLNLSQAAPESPGYFSESSPFAKIRDHRAIASSTAGSANAGAAVMIHQVPEVTQNSGAIQFNDSSLSEEAAKAELVTSSDSDVNHTTLTELLARAETLTSSSGGSKSGEEKNMQSVSKANIRPLTTFYDTMDLTIKQTNYLDDDNQSISSLGSNSTAAEEASTASEVVRSFEKDIGKGISMSQSSSSVSSIAFAEDHNEDGVIASANQANTSMSQESDSSTNRLLTEWEKRYNLVQETKQSPPKVEDRILREQERIQREYLDEQLRIRKLQEERERRTQLQQQELARQRQELMERMQSLGQASSPVRSSPPKSQPQPAVESPEDNMSTSSTLSSDAFFQANIPSSLLRDDGDDQGSTASSASSISLSVHLTSNVMSPAKQPQPHQTVTTTTAVTSEQSTSNNKMKTHFANDLTSHILNEVSSEIEADLVEESSSQSSTSFSGISSTFLSQSQPTSSTLQVSDTFTRTTGALPPTSRPALPSPMKDDRRYNTSGLFSDESSNMDLQSEGYSHAGSTLTEIQQEILEMRRRLMMAVSYPNPSAIPTITANPYTRSTTAMSAATTTSANMMEHSTTNYTNFTNTYNSTMTNLDVLGSALRTYPNSSVFHDSSDDSSDAIVYGQKRETIPGTALSSSGLRPPTTTTSQQPQDVSMDSLQEGSLSSEDYKTSPTPPSHTIYSSSTANVVNLTTQSSSSSALNIRATTTTSSTNNMNATYRASYSTNRNTVPTIASTTYTTRRSLDDTSLSTGSLHSGEYDDDYLRSSMQSQVSRGYSSSVARTSNAQTGYDATSTPSEDTLSNYPIDSSYSLTGSKSQLTPLSHSESSPSKLYSTGGTLDATPTQFYQIHEESDENEDSDEDRMANDDDLSHQSSLA